MIRRIVLENWRNYVDLDIYFFAGTTFVVASNGVGKTSLIEAARFGLFGRLDSPSTAVRAGQPSARVSLELVLPSHRVLEIARELPSDLKPRQALPVPAVRVDGASISVDELDELLASEYAAEQAFLARLTMPLSDSGDAPANMGLEEHLGQYFGIEGLRGVLARLQEELKTCERDTRRLKLDHAATAKKLDELTAETADAQAVVAQAEARHETATAILKHANSLASAREAQAAWDAAAQKRMDQQQELAEEAAAMLGAPVRGVEVDEVVSQALAAVTSEMNNLRVELGLTESNTAALTDNLRRLERATGDCPVCRRPLDEHTATLAAQEIDRDRQRLSDRTARLMASRDELHARETELLGLDQKVRSLPVLPPRPETTDPPADLPDLAEAETAQQESMDALVGSRARFEQAKEKLDEAQQADAAMARLLGLLRREAKLTIAIATTESTLREILDQAVLPLRSEIDSRWSALFPDRGKLHTPPNGAVTREVNGIPLPYDAFSAGEGAGLRLLVRLLVAQMASSVDFCWFDEPLEHLDPDTRRQVANILTRATSTDSQVQQILVTTYEEPLARQLHLRDPGRVHLIDVRQ